MRTRHLVVGASLVLLSTLPLAQCARQAAPPPPAPGSEMQGYVSIREVMTNIIDPLSDNIFDAVGVDVTAAGMVETAPTTDEDWAKVRQGAIALAEGANLLKIHRRVAPENDNVSKNPGEMHPDEVGRKIDANRALWNSHVDLMRDEALKVLAIADARDGSRLFQAGSDIDKACETCHLEFWYPGDRAAVQRDQNSKTFTEPAKP